MFESVNYDQDANKFQLAAGLCSIMLPAKNAVDSRNGRAEHFAQDRNRQIINYKDEIP